MRDRVFRAPSSRVVQKDLIKNTLERSAAPGVGVRITRTGRPSVTGTKTKWGKNTVVRPESWRLHR